MSPAAPVPNGIAVPGSDAVVAPSPELVPELHPYSLTRDADPVVAASTDGAGHAGGDGFLYVSRADAR